MTEMMKYLRLAESIDKEMLNALLKTLTYREREIIKLRSGIGDGRTYTRKEIGQMFRITNERVRQVEAKAILKLQHPVRERKLQAIFCVPPADSFPSA